VEINSSCWCNTYQHQVDKAVDSPRPIINSRILNVTIPLLVHTPEYQLSAHKTMAGDTRDSTTSGASPTKYETFTGPPPSANALPAGSGQNTAGSKAEPLSLKDAIGTVRWQDFSQVHMYPCVRESFLMGIAGAFGAGSFKAIFGGSSYYIYPSPVPQQLESVYVERP